MKTKIEWTDYTINCFWGCRQGCSYCQARKFATRFSEYFGKKRGYPQEIIDKMKRFEPIFLYDQLHKIGMIKKPSKIFISFMGDPFCDDFKGIVQEVFGYMELYPQHTFIMLTKQPQNIPLGIPSNCWVGVSIDTRDRAYQTQQYFKNINAKVKFVSVEPLLECPDAWLLSQIIPYADWIIIGQQTRISKLTSPKIEWIKTIVSEADRNKIPVFLKDNLRKLLPTYYPFYKKHRENYEEKGVKWNRTWDDLRQEFPIVK